MPQISDTCVVEAFLCGVRVCRAALYGHEEDQQLPRNLTSDARVPFLGFCGPRYSKGGLVLLAINPGGGGDSYVARTPQDQALIPLIEKFRDSSPLEPRPFEEMCASYSAHAQTWNLWRILHPTLEACGYALDSVCYLNLFPYRTANDVRPSARALNAAWLKVVSPLIAVLQPSLLVALGKKAGAVAERFHRQPPPLYVVPRSIGDSYISQGAEQVLAQIRGRLKK